MRADRDLASAAHVAHGDVDAALALLDTHPEDALGPATGAGSCPRSAVRCSTRAASASSSA
ncbi:MAG: hypothetical protein U0414_23875 [Polyangiaceae bacterium]